MNIFLKDTLEGLKASPKYLKSKYFYNEVGDAIFRDIMASPDYYLTQCELDIFTHQSAEILEAINKHLSHFDVIELGPGDCYKSMHLLRVLMQRGMNFTYYPIDISRNVINSLETTLPKQLPGLKVAGLNGDYLQMLGKVAPAHESENGTRKNKLVLFLGSSIGNFTTEETGEFFRHLQEQLLPGDAVLTGFDLKKDPEVILRAYNDREGITRRFNLNLLNRINEELGADFNPQFFEHKPVYNETTGACKSYLKSTKDQQVSIGPDERISFRQGEQVLMEISQKYTVAQTDEIAKSAGFVPAAHFFDSKMWFLDALWIR